MPDDPAAPLPLPVLLLVGFLIGGIGTIVGLGGGFLLVPFLRLAAKIDPIFAIGTSLFAVFFNSLSASATFLLKKRVDLRTAFWYSAATIPGVLIGVELAKMHKPQVFDIAFGVIMLVIGWRTVASKAGDPSAESAGKPVGEGYRVDLMRGIPVSFGAGIIASLFGIGGGAIHVPFMALVVGMPVHIATATSQCILAVTAGVSTARYGMQGVIDYEIAIPVAVSLVVGGQCGAWLSERMKARAIRIVLAFFLDLVGVLMILRGMSAPA